MRPTDAELAILGVLWERGPSTVKDFQKVLEKTKKTGYTTVLKFMQIMVEKGLVNRDDSSFAHVYQARIPREQTQRTLVADLLERLERITAPVEKLIMTLWIRSRQRTEIFHDASGMADQFRSPGPLLGTAAFRMAGALLAALLLVANALTRRPQVR